VAGLGFLAYQVILVAVFLVGQALVAFRDIAVLVFLDLVDFRAQAA
jgi:hypothetical protein